MPSAMNDVDSLYPQLKTIEAMPREMCERYVTAIQSAIDDVAAYNQMRRHLLSPGGFAYKSDFISAFEVDMRSREAKST